MEEASFLSLAAVMALFVLIGVSPTVSAVPVDFDENHAENMLHDRTALPSGG